MRTTTTTWPTACPSHIPVYILIVLRVDPCHSKDGTFNNLNHKITTNIVFSLSLSRPLFFSRGSDLTGQQAIIAQVTGTFCRAYLWGMIPYAVFDNLKRCLQVWQQYGLTGCRACLSRRMYFLYVRVISAGNRAPGL